MTSTRITNGGKGDLFQAVSGSNVVWQGWDGVSDYEIYMTTVTGPIRVPLHLVRRPCPHRCLVVGSVAWARRR